SLVAAVIFMPLIEPVASLCRRLLPSKPVADDPGRPRHLDPNVLDAPAEALACALRATLALGGRVAYMLRQSIAVFEHSDPQYVTIPIRRPCAPASMPPTPPTASMRRSSSTSSRPRAPISARRKADGMSRS